MDIRGPDLKSPVSGTPESQDKSFKSQGKSPRAQGYRALLEKKDIHFVREEKEK